MLYYTKITRRDVNPVLKFSFDKFYLFFIITVLFKGPTFYDSKSDLILYLRETLLTIYQTVINESSIRNEQEGRINESNTSMHIVSFFRIKELTFIVFNGF